MSLTRKHVDEEGRPASLQLDVHMPRWTHSTTLNDASLTFIHVDCMIELLYSLMGPLSRLPHGSRAARRYRALPATKCSVENNISCLLVRALALNYRTRHVKCGCCYTGLFLALRQLVVWCCAEFAVLCSTACHVTHTVDHLPYIHPAAATCVCVCVCAVQCSAVQCQPVPVCFVSC